jgi:putative holliday junction resolvase
MSSRSIIGLDVGSKRIGVAVCDTGIKIAVAYDTIEVDGNELQAIAEVIVKESADTIVVGYPRNQQGESTAQTSYVEQFAKQLEDMVANVVFQDESLTSVIAEQQLKESKQPYAKADIDARAAAIILQDYIDKEVR